MDGHYLPSYNSRYRYSYPSNAGKTADNLLIIRMRGSAIFLQAKS
jgi:hypothetical protein